MKPYDIAQIFSQMETDLIASMKRNLARHEAEEAKEGFEWEQWQRRKLQALAAYRKQNRAIVGGYGGKVDRMVKAMMKGSFEDGALQVDGTIRRLWNQIKHLFSAGQLTMPITQVDDSDESFFRMNERRINALIDAVTNDLRNGRAAMLRHADDVYRQTIFKSAVYLNSGASSLNQAIDMATMDFLDKGFDCITYSNGRKVNIASYAEMALRAASQRAVFAGEGLRRQEWGIHTVLVSAHNNCSNLCLPWQGKPFVDDVYSGGKSGENGGMTLLSTAMAGGLFHPHCRHNMSTFFPGISSLPESVDDSTAQANYKAEQRQRYMERQIRRYKRRAAGSIDPVNQAAAEAKVKEWQGILRNHLDAHPQLRRDYRREKLDMATKSDIINKKTFRKFDSADEVKAWSDKVSTSWLNSLTVQEADSIRFYSGDGYTPINRLLRRGEVDAYYQELADSISTGLRKFHLQEGVVTYRGMFSSQFDGANLEDLIGAEVKDEGFMSTSLLPNSAFSGNVQIELQVPRGRYGAAIIALSEYPEEYEFLLDKGTAYVIREAKREDGVLKIKAEVKQNGKK